MKMALGLETCFSTGDTHASVPEFPGTSADAIEEEE
jgi:hypothetical protein